MSICVPFQVRAEQLHVMNENLTVLKLGGALLTDKQRPFTLRQSILDQAAAEVKACLDAGLLERLLLVHGVGSFGHPPVMEYKLYKGFNAPSQLIHLTYTQNRVMELRAAIAKACYKAGIPVSTILPSSCMTAVGAAQKSSALDAAAGFLAIGMVPLLGGDMLADEQMGFCVYGGDKIAVDLALHFGASRLIFATAVDGIYDQDPHQHPAAQRVAQFSLSRGGSAVQLDTHQQVDASGAMAGKLAALHPAHDAMTAGLHVHVISMMKKGSLFALLNGEQEIGTIITP